MKVLLIEHFDSFSYNLVQWLKNTHNEFCQKNTRHSFILDLMCVTYDQLYAKSLDQVKWDALVLSPGPGSPAHLSDTRAFTRSFLGAIPILGVCLGHQVLGHLLGLETREAVEPCHGSRREIRITAAQDLFCSFAPNQRAQVAYYNSLVIQDHLIPGLTINAVDHETSEVQAFTYQLSGQNPCFGLQFHPESFLSEEVVNQLGVNWWREVCRSSYFDKVTRDPLSIPSKQRI